MAKVRGQRTAESYISKDPVKRAKSLANLSQFRGKKVIQTESVERKPGPFSSVYQNNIIGFLEDHYYIPETKAPVKLEDWQKERIFEPLFEIDPETGLRRFSLGLVGLAKKNSKSTMAAMIGNYFLFQDEEFGEIILTANSKDQSSWIIFDKLKKSLLMNPEQFKYVNIFDEDSLLYELYKSGFEGKDPKMFFLWEHKNLASWMTEDYLSSQRKRLRPGTYKRLYCNEWGSGEEAFIEMDLWDQYVDRKNSPCLPDRNVDLVVRVNLGTKEKMSKGKASK